MTSPISWQVLAIIPSQFPLLNLQWEWDNWVWRTTHLSSIVNYHPGPFASNSTLISHSCSSIPLFPYLRLLQSPQLQPPLYQPVLLHSKVMSSRSRENTGAGMVWPRPGCIVNLPCLLWEQSWKQWVCFGNWRVRWVFWKQWAAFRRQLILGMWSWSMMCWGVRISEWMGT